MPFPHRWKRLLAAAVAVLAAPALVFLTFDALVANGDRSVDRPALVETLGRASRSVGTAIRGAGERLRGGRDGHAVTPSAAAPAEEPPVTPRRAEVPILVYHNVAVPAPTIRAADRAYYVTPDEFEAQMAYLETGGRVAVSPDDVAEAVRGGKPLPEKPVLIAFDDDRETQYSAAFPVLKRHGLTATFYVFTNAIGKKGYLTWDQLREMRDAGMGIQSHSVFHPFLDKLDDAALRKELSDSKTTLEKGLGVAVTSFAYPFGLHEDRVVAAVRDAGYVTARTLRHTPYVGTEDLYTMPGYIVTGDLGVFAQIVAGTRK